MSSQQQFDDVFDPHYCRGCRKQFKHGELDTQGLCLVCRQEVALDCHASEAKKTEGKRRLDETLITFIYAILIGLCAVVLVVMDWYHLRSMWHISSSELHQTLPRIAVLIGILSAYSYLVGCAVKSDYDLKNLFLLPILIIPAVVFIPQLNTYFLAGNDADVLSDFVCMTVMMIVIYLIGRKSRCI